MSFFVPRRRSDPERMDGETRPEAIGGALRDLARINRFLGGVRLSVRSVAPFASAGPLSILDVAAGGGDVGAALFKAAGARSRVVAADRNPIMLAAARRVEPRLLCVAADARALPFRDRAFDVVHTSLFLHHLEPDEAGAVLRELRRVARRAVVVNDLRRHRVALASIRVLTRLFFRSELVRHDGPLSVLRAYTPREVREICAREGLPAPRIARGFGYRMSIVLPGSGEWS